MISKAHNLTTEEAAMCMCCTCSGAVGVVVSSGA
mgnify:CR=1 FL=1